VDGYGILSSNRNPDDYGPLGGVELPASRETMLNVLAFADRAKNDPFVLKYLIHAIGKRRQHELILALPRTSESLKDDQRVPDYRWQNVFLPDILQTSKEYEVTKNYPDLKVSLASDVVLPYPWTEKSYISRFPNMGHDVGKPWKQDVNHKITLFLPTRFSFVDGGNHSIMCGILKSEGLVKPRRILDITPVFADLLLVRDGECYSYKGEERPIPDYEMATALELTRRLIATGKAG
jgi:hypothetical protein